MLLPPMAAAVPSGEPPAYIAQVSATGRRRRRDSLLPPPPYSPRSLRAPRTSDSHDRQASSPASQDRTQLPPPPYAPRRKAFWRPSPQPAIAARVNALLNHNERTERLRRFLSFSLAIDYDLQDSTPDRLSASDWSRFVRLAEQMSEACSAAEDRDFRNPWCLDDTLESLMTPALRFQIEEPATILGVRLQTVLSQLRLFISSIHRCKGGSGYLSQLERMPVDQGMREFGQKLICDRAELIEAVLPKFPKAMCPYRGLKVQMKVRNQTIIDRWFVKLDKWGYVARKGHSGELAGDVQFPEEMFAKEVIDVMALSRLLQSDGSKIACWRRWKYVSAKRRESKLYLLDGEEELQESCFVRALWRLIDK